MELSTVGSGWEGSGMAMANKPGQMERNTKANG